MWKSLSLRLSSLFKRFQQLERRSLILGIGLGLMALSGLYAPWNYTHVARGRTGIIAMAEPAPRALLFAPPSPEEKDERCGVVLDFKRLLVEWFVIGTGTGAVALLFTAKRRE